MKIAKINVFFLIVSILLMSYGILQYFEFIKFSTKAADLDMKVCVDKSVYRNLDSFKNNSVELSSIVEQECGDYYTDLSSTQKRTAYISKIISNIQVKGL